MAIRFHCASCAQPIEVDDEWAQKLVACPYCRKTITAPGETQIADIGSIPTASEAIPAPGAEPGPESAPPMPPEINRPAANGVAVASLVLAFALFACLTTILILYSVNAEEIREQAQRATDMIEEGGDFFESIQVVANEQATAQPSVGLTVAAGLQFVAILIWIATLVCGILGVRHAYRRGLAIVSLCVVGVAPLVMCCGVMRIVM